MRQIGYICVQVTPHSKCVRLVTCVQVTSHSKCVRLVSYAFKSPSIQNALDWLRAFKSPYINACRVNSNTALKKPLFILYFFIIFFIVFITLKLKSEKISIPERRCKQEFGGLDMVQRP